MNKLSIKLGLAFFIIIILLQTFLIFFLHESMVDSRIEEEISALQARGNSHRTVLKSHFDNATIDHVALMESEANTDVVITDPNGMILNASNTSNAIINLVQIPKPKIPEQGKTIESNWKQEPYIATISPIRHDDENIGYVFMFKHTESVHSLIHRLNEHFLIAGSISVMLTLIIIVFFSKALTRPLIEMKEATFKMSKGDFTVQLPQLRNDELGSLSQSIQVLANDLNHLKQERKEFLASISHELRTPLTYIKGYTDIILKRELPVEEQRNYLKIIMEETIHLSALVKDLFDLAKLDQNNFVIQKTPIELNQFLENIKDRLLPAFTEKGMDLSFNCPDQLILNADPLRLEQIIINLLDNAMKYSSNGERTLVKVYKGKGSVNIQIEDNGKGIPSEELPHIFNRFYRVEKSRARSTGGIGLGLSIVKELVQAHGGTIDVQSNEHIGTTFLITFPGE